MKRILFAFACTTAAWLTTCSVAHAQVYVRAPFVRVQVGGGGVAVRAPFVNLFIPPAPYYVPGPGPIILPGPGPQPLPGDFFPPAPTPMRVVPMPEPIGAPQPNQPQPNPTLPNDGPPPPAVQGPRVMTANEFAKSFQPKAGSYEVTILNPITNQPNTVRFTLPEGSPKRVNVNRREIEFFYGPRNFVRIEFDRDGVQVISR